MARLCSQRDLLVRLISYLKSQVDNGSVPFVDPYQSFPTELRKLDFVEAVWVEWLEEGECSSAYFLRLEKKHCALSLLYEIITGFAFWYLGHPGRIVIFLFQSLC